MVVVSCTPSTFDPPPSTPIDSVPIEGLEDIIQHDPDSEELLNPDAEEDTYSIYTDPCVECKWYFCPPLDAVWQKQLCVNVCEDPPTIVYETECIEYLECDPSQPIMETELPCVTDGGYPGTQDKICNKGQIQYTSCVTECDDESCNGEDDDCDSIVDEGFADTVEECNNIDDNCNGVVDEGEWECDNGCGPGPNLCVAGEFVCTAPFPDEEICDGSDNDCDDEIDEGQLNKCNMCGAEPEEICDGFDNDCDGFTDEDLINPCSTACGEGYEVCSTGNWISCNAPPVFEEICDGLDNDCDGQIDEELQCICTVQDVGTLFPCHEAPLLCGQGYKTCECIDPQCKVITTTPCYSICYWLADPWGSDPSCDPYVGIALADEKCNNFDDDCDQTIDEDLFAGCYTGSEGTLYVGICEPGEMTCDAGAWGHYSDETQNFIPSFCKDEITPQTEICNGLDDDCDGEVDWGEELKDTDVLFVVDWSGSMQDEIAAVMTALNQFASNFKDESVIQWGIILGPRETPSPLFKDQLVLFHNLSGFTDFLNSMSGLTFTGMNTSKEMLLDALYLSLFNVSGNVPYVVSDLKWVGYGIADSAPPKDNFSIDWRPGADKIIIVFTDEGEQSYLSHSDPPTQANVLSTNDIINTAVGTPQLKIYTFAKSESFDWDEIAAATGGKYFPLSNKPMEVYAGLIEILDEICASGD
jgi:hypothetical protein